jgi:hypothetical protein
MHDPHRSEVDGGSRRGSGPTRRELLSRGLALGALGALGGVSLPSLASAARRPWPTAPLGAAAALSVDPSQFMPITQMAAWQHALDDIGLRATGSAVHARYADGLAARLERVGVTSVQTEAVPLARWEPSKWGLEVVGGAGAGRVGVASYVPYSGQTPAAGVTGPLSLAQPATGNTIALGVAPAPGTIGLVNIAPDPIPLALFEGLNYATADGSPPGFPPGTSAATIYDRAWVTQGYVENALKTFQGSGVLGLVFVLPLPANAAQGMYMPYHGVNYDVPALFVDRDVGAQLQQVAAGGGSVRLTLPAQIKKVTTPNIYGVIPGRSEELVILESHHDGTNGLEENGCEAILSMSQYLARLPRCALPRTVLVLLSTGHFAGNALGCETFIHRHLDAEIARTAAAFTIEHLGALEWLPDASGQFTLTGRYEIGGAFDAPFNAVINPTRAAIQAANVTEPPFVMRPYGTDSRSPDGLVWPGDGEGFWTIAGLPSGNFITGPTYLLNGGMRVAQMIDIAAVRRQSIAFTNLILTLGRTPLTELQRRRPDDPVMHASDTSPGVSATTPCSAQW